MIQRRIQRKAQRNRFRRIIDGGQSFDGDLKSISDIDWWMLQELNGLVALATSSALALGRNTAGLTYADYIPGAGWSDLGSEVARSANGALLRQVGILAVGKTFQVTLTISNYVSGNLRLRLGSGTITAGQTGDGEKVYSGTCTGSADLFLDGQSAFNGDVDLKLVLVQQTDILASSEYAPGTNPMDGVNTACAVGQLADGNLGYAYGFDGATSYLDLTSTEFNSILNPLAADGFEELLFVQKDTWDVTERDILSYTVDANNWIRIVDTTTVGTISFQFRAGGTTKEVLLVLGATPPTSWMLLGISVKNNVLSAWYNGQLVGTIAIVTTFVGNFVTMLIGARTTVPTFVHLGQVTRIGAARRELSSIENIDIWQGSGLA